MLVEVTMALEQLYRMESSIYNFSKFGVTLGVYAKAYGVQMVYLQRSAVRAQARSHR
jgi:hypothetical protein